ncbi:MAG: LysR family transcriptional regulator [Clostridia bacterium]|nr:LysR family transcriptional regulator [Clostridia bacterium]
MELRNITTFLKIAETGSFTRAAAQLGYNQSTVTVQIQQLEQELGVMLFDRVGRRISLTEKGYEFLGYAHEIVRAAEKAKSIAQKDRKAAGMIRAAAAEELLTPTFMQMLSLYHARFPEVEIDLRIVRPDEQLAALRAGELDMGLILGEPIEGDEYILAWERRDRAVFVTRPDNLPPSTTPLSLEALCAQRLILPCRGSGFRDLFEKAAAESGLHVRPAVSINHLGSVKQLLGAENTVALLPEFAVRDELADGSLQVLAVDCPEMRLRSQMLYHRSKWVSPPMQELLDLMSCYRGLFL